MRTILLCGQLFSGIENVARKEQAVVIESGRITFVGPIAQSPQASPSDEVVDYRGYFVMPGLSS